MDKTTYVEYESVSCECSGAMACKDINREVDVCGQIRTLSASCSGHILARMSGGSWMQRGSARSTVATPIPSENPHPLWGYGFDCEYQGDEHLTDDVDSVSIQ
jgi:hypothetical protein